VLLAHGADPNRQDVDGVSALMEAVSTHHNELIGTLMAHGVDPALKDRKGRTATDIATQKGNDEAAGLIAGR
jgi:hypothetical protein